MRQARVPTGRTFLWRFVGPIDGLKKLKMIVAISPQRRRQLQQGDARKPPNASWCNNGDARVTSCRRLSAIASAIASYGDCRLQCRHFTTTTTRTNVANAMCQWAVCRPANDGDLLTEWRCCISRSCRLLACVCAHVKSV